MKIYILIVLLSTTISCKAQSEVLDISQKGEIPSLTANLSDKYYKDLNNLLNPFEGTYVYSEGDTYLKLVLQKKEMCFFGDHYEDMIIGEYQYIKNGIEIVNTLPKLNQNIDDKRNHGIDGNQILTGNQLCEECSPTDKHLHVGLVEDGKGRASMSIRKVTVNGQEAIKVFFYWHYKTHVVGTPESPSPSLPGGVYIMLKQ